MNFSEALSELKNGKVLSRKTKYIYGYVAIQAGYLEIKANQNTLDAFKFPKDTVISHKPYLQRAICQNTNEGGQMPKELSFYLPSNEDLFAEDWYVVA